MPVQLQKGENVLSSCWNVVHAKLTSLRQYHAAMRGLLLSSFTHIYLTLTYLRV